MIAAAAPAVIETAAAPNAAPATPANAAPAGFDAILMLQSLAATPEALDSASFETEDIAEGLASDDDEEQGDDLDASLAFLAALMNITTGDYQAGGQQHGSPEENARQSSPAAALSADVGFTLSPDTEKKSELLSLLTEVPPETQESRGASPDATQHLSRAAELLAQAQRPAAADVGKPAVLTHARDPRWADDFSARVSLMIRAGESTASLQLTPVDLGPVEVNVTVKDSQATIHFGATQADTRALIEASLPKLRELLASQGFNLLDASVSSGFSQAQRQGSAPGGGAPGSANESETSITEARSVRALGLLDVYA